MLFSVPKETDREKWKCSSGLEGESSCCTLRLWVSLEEENGILAGMYVLASFFPASRILSFHESWEYTEQDRYLAIVALLCMQDQLQDTMFSIL